jgi:hypothetical protein
VFDLTLVSEREPTGSWEDCAWATGVMLGNWMEGYNKYPANQTNYENLRYAATGVREAEGDGSNYDEVLRGVERLYGLEPLLLHSANYGWDYILRHWPIHYGGGVQGRNGSLPSTLRYTSFTGGHSIFTVRRTDELFDAYNPLAPAGSNPRSITADQLGVYFRALPGAAVLLGGEGEKHWKDRMFKLSQERWVIKPGAAVYEAPDPRSAVVSHYPRTTGYEINTLGEPLDRSNNGVDYEWRACIIATVAFTGEKTDKIGWIRRSDLLTLKSTPSAWDETVRQVLRHPEFTAQVVQIDATADQLKQAKQAGFDAALAAVKSDLGTLKLTV